MDRIAKGNLRDARSLIRQYVDHCNQVRLHSAIGFVTPQDMLACRQAEIHAARDRKIETARTTSTAPTASRMRYGLTMILPGQTEAGSCRDATMAGVARRAHRDDDRERGNPLLALAQNLHRTKDPPALKIITRRAGYSLAENSRPPFQAEPAWVRLETTRTVGGAGRRARWMEGKGRAGRERGPGKGG